MQRNRGYRVRADEQVPTRPTTIVQIMSQWTFALGVADAHTGRPMHRDFDTWTTNDQWGYERGRQWAQAAPRTLALKCDGKITAKAMQYYDSDIL